MNSPSKTYCWPERSKLSESSINPLHVCSSAKLVSLVKDLTRLPCLPRIISAIAAISNNIFKLPSSELEIGFFRGSLCLSSPFMSLLLTIFQNDRISSMNFTVPLTSLGFSSGWLFRAAIVFSQKTFKHVDTFCLSIGLGKTDTSFNDDSFVNSSRSSR